MSEVDTPEVLETPTATVQIAGQAREIRPLGLYQLPAFVRALKPALPKVMAAIGESGSINPLIVADLLADHGEDLIEAVRLAIGLSKVEMQSAGIDEVLEAVPVVLKINRDFFIRRLVPALQRAAVAAAEARAPGDGPTSSMP